MNRYLRQMEQARRRALGWRKVQQPCSPVEAAAEEDRLWRPAVVRLLEAVDPL
jgi:hypothetical protein